MGITAHHRRSRRSFAICAAVLWLLGVEVLPGLHLATHDHDHTHTADGTIVAHRDHDHDHEHGGHHHELGGHDADFGHAPERARRTRDQLAFHAVELGHAAAGLAHHATALHQPPPPVVTPVAVPHAKAWRHAAPIERIASAATARPTARGPPVA